MARLRNVETKIGPRGFRAVLFRMVPKQKETPLINMVSFRAVLFRMVPKRLNQLAQLVLCFRAVLFRMVPKPLKAVVSS
ncbi:hypothetical protein D817_06448 [Streptococcus mutans KK21]|nr:hypothetical protein D817_06448 [Streptococcus mutans KK21]